MAEAYLQHCSPSHPIRNCVVLIAGPPLPHVSFNPGCRFHMSWESLWHSSAYSAVICSAEVGLVIGLGALSLALLSVFGGDLATKARTLRA